MKTHLIFFTSVFLITINSFGQSLDWYQHFSGKNFDRVYAVVSDAYGNVYSAGSFRDSIYYDNNKEHSAISPIGVASAYIVKHNSEGEYLWSAEIGELGTNSIYSLVTDADRNVYANISFRGVVDFDPGPASDIGVADPNGSFAILKFSEFGDLIWSRPGHTFLDLDDGVLISQTGEFWKPHLSTIAENGNVLSSSNFYYPFNPTESVNFLDVQKLNEQIIVVGSNRADFYGNQFVSDENIVLENENGGSNASVFSYDNEYNFQWAFQLKTSASSSFNRVKKTMSGSLITVGYVVGNVEYEDVNGAQSYTTVGPEGVVVEFNSEGQILKLLRFPGISINDLSVTDYGYVYVTGKFNGNVDFDLSSNEAILISNNDDGFLLEMDENLDYVSAFKITGDGKEEVFALDVNNEGDIYLVANFFNNALLDLTNEIEVITPSNTEDAFIAKYKSSVASFSEIDAESNLVWPNPAVNTLNFSKAVKQYHIVDILGNIIRSGNSNEGKVDISKMHTGIYFISLDGKESIKFIKQ